MKKSTIIRCGSYYCCINHGSNGLHIVEINRTGRARCRRRIRRRAEVNDVYKCYTSDWRKIAAVLPYIRQYGSLYRELKAQCNELHGYARVNMGL